ncbi:MAG: hypothetical protein ABSG68_18100 [Thermoguttaceae bacterium]|jgi:predicted hotdog family 3-hydroxylacyl-ACP dehydratase
MTHEYRLPRGPRADRLAEISGATDLSAEIRLSRLIAEELAASGDPAAAQVAAVIGRLCERSQSLRIEAGSLLSARQVQVIAERMCQAVYHRVEHLPQRDAIVDALIGDFQQIFADAQNQFRLTSE